MTIPGQVSFASHVDAVLAVVVDLVNLSTPGFAYGRNYQPSSQTVLDSQIAALLGAHSAELPTLTPADSADLVAFAERCRRIFEAVAEGDLHHAATRVNTELRKSGARPQLDLERSGGLELHFHGRNDSVAVGWIAGCATGLAIVLGSDLRARLGICAAERCDRVFVDISRNRGRRFCSTACQNRSKAATFRDRRGNDGREHPSPGSP